MDRSHGQQNLPFAICAIILGLLLGGAAIWGANKQVLGLFHDDGIYAVVAKAVYQGEGYRIISLPTSPPQTKYPFLYSYLLSWFWALNPSFPENIWVLKALNCGILLAIFFLAFGFYRRFYPVARLAALVFAVLVCTNPILFTYTDYVVSDLLFVLLALAGLFLARPSADSIASAGRPLWLGFISGLASLTRLAAAPLVLAGLAHAFLTRGWRGLGYFSGAVFLLVAPWLYWLLIINRDPSRPALFSYYGAYDFSVAGVSGIGGVLASRGPIVSGNARYLLDSFDLLYLLPLMPWLASFVVVFTALGMIVSLRTRETFTWTFVLSSVALLLVWPFHPGRYMAPLVPVLVLFLFRGMASAERWFASVGGDYPFKELITKVAWLPAIVLLMLNGVWLSSYLLIQDDQTTRGGYGRRVPYGWGGFEESFAWIRKNTAVDARLGTAYDPMYYLYTGRQAIRPALHRSATYFYPYGQAKPDVGSAAAIKAELDELRIDYLIIDPLDGYAEGKATVGLLEQIVGAYGAKAKNVFTSTDGKHRIFAILRP